MPAGLVNGNGESVTMDSLAYYVNMGKLYAFYNESTDLDTGASKDTLVVTGSKECHVVFNLEAFGGQVVAYIYEDTITSDDGVELQCSRLNRNRPKECGVKVYDSPTVVNLGHEFTKRRVLAYAQGNGAITSIIQPGAKRILKPNTKYLLRQTAVSDNISLTLVGTFHEE